MTAPDKLDQAIARYEEYLNPGKTTEAKDTELQDMEAGQ